MALIGYTSVFLVGLFGGVLLELMHWWNLRRRNENFPEYARSIKYWLITLLMALAGGVLAVFYFGDRAEALVALHVGISSPLILQKLATTMAEPGARSVKSTTIISFFSW